MNVLMLGGAKRVSMARMISNALQRVTPPSDPTPTLYSYEMDSRVPIATVATVIIGKRWDDPAIYDHLNSLCRTNNIGIIIPFVDGAVAVAAEMMHRYPDRIFAPTCSPGQAAEMFDKVIAADIFAANSLPIPPTYRPGTAANPVCLIAKPRRGSASKGIVAIDDISMIDSLPAGPDNYLIQQRIDHRHEYTCDCYISVRDHTVAAIVPRLRVEVSGGEVSRTITVDNPNVSNLAMDAIKALGLCGAVTIQIIHDLDTDRYMIMEINPRLGGGAVCAVHADADLPAMIVADAMGVKLTNTAYRVGTEIVRYPAEVVFYNEL